MVETSVAESSYPTSWSTVVSAFLRRYPNPYATHVISVDTIDRQLVPASYPRRQWPLLSKEGSLVEKASYEATAAKARSVSQDMLREPQHRWFGSSSSSPIRSTRRQGSPHDPSIEDELFEPLVLRTTRLILKRGTLPKWAPSGIIKNAESWVLEETEVEVDLDLPAAVEDLSSSATRSVPNRQDMRQKGREMRVWTRNLDHTNVLAVTEGVTLREELEELPFVAVAHTSPSPELRTKYNFFGSSSSPASAMEQSSASLVASRSLPLTHCLTTGHVSSSVGFSLLQRRIEKFGVKRFKAHSDTSRAGLLWVVDAAARIRAGDLSALEILRASLAAAHVDGDGAHSDARSMGAEDGTGVGDASTGWAIGRGWRESADGQGDRTRPRLRAAFRPPFLDGYPATPLQRLRNWWKGEPGRVQQAKEAEERIRWAYKARELFEVNLPPLPSSEEGVRNVPKREAEHGGGDAASRQT
ncbi:hypothetical protein K437DRAFT_274982 [Tilletiaria anomala UBC 951]|uniref:PRELI/MSF1 domain-containing protein n=1 Tax=Tilletiaria anomala (strain ATCC 24038 / CBS 436.72 / UBC 951) TaxID=1037660 RepID=A0A066VW99_TILAU|nr:uncharacterized protein K437DRAFT_274982 [Tilletiaria anomala UBC 951]KDN43089.1 hypothetical protein K437DRAFT_274982 [Tilletiaria anomala UBC 951]